MPSKTVETNTNQLYRKKYYVPADRVIFAREGVSPAEQSEEKKFSNEFSKVFRASSVSVAKKSVPLSSALNKSQIKVDIVKEGNRVKGINIRCPCGRHAELDVEYAAK